MEEEKEPGLPICLFPGDSTGFRIPLGLVLNVPELGHNFSLQSSRSHQSYRLGPHWDWTIIAKLSLIKWFSQVLSQLGGLRYYFIAKWRRVLEMSLWKEATMSVFCVITVRWGKEWSEIWFTTAVYCWVTQNTGTSPNRFQPPSARWLGLHYDVNYSLCSVRAIPLLAGIELCGRQSLLSSFKF